MLPCGMPNSNRTGCDLELEAITIWKKLARNDDNDKRAEDEMPNQCFKQWSRILWSIVLNAAERSRKRREWNGQNLKKLKYHFERKVEQFQRNEICDMLINIQT